MERPGTRKAKEPPSSFLSLARPPRRKVCKQPAPLSTVPLAYSHLTRTEHERFPGQPCGNGRANFVRAPHRECSRTGGRFRRGCSPDPDADAVTDAALPGNPITFANQAFIDLSGYTRAGFTNLVAKEPLAFGRP